MSTGYAVDPSWRPMLRDLGVRTEDVLRRAGLPQDLFSRDETRLPSERYFALWRALEAEVADPLLPIRIGEAATAESFMPALFAALCSPDLSVAVTRIRQYKRLVCPMRVLVDDDENSGLEMRLDWIDTPLSPPPSLVASELVFFVQLARLATRERIVPLEVGSPVPLDDPAYADWFGVAVSQAERPTLRFSHIDSRRPFLTANSGMWQIFEPTLRRRLAELEDNATTTERVRAALLEALPSGTFQIEQVARTLALSRRTLQRRLRTENTTFQRVLRETRSSLALHYLGQPRLTTTEIAFLLGFSEPTSFYRAFHDWTGNTPDQARQSV